MIDVDYADLLKRYMFFMLDFEGTTALHWVDVYGDLFTDEERLELYEIEKEVIKIRKLKNAQKDT